MNSFIQEIGTLSQRSTILSKDVSFGLINFDHIEGRRWQILIHLSILESFDDEIQEISGLVDSTLFENASSPVGKTEQAYRNNSFSLGSPFGKSIC